MAVFGIVVAAFLIAIGALGILGNLAVVFTVSINKRFRLVRYLFLASLAVSDFVIAALIVPFHVASKLHEELEFSTTQCKVITFLTRALYCSTTLHLIAVSYDRYLAIVKSPLTYNQGITKAKILLLMAFAWILPFATAAGPWFTIWEGTFPFGARLYYCDICHGWDVQSRDQLTRSVFLSVAAFAVPLLVLAWLNIRVFKAASQVEQEIITQQAQVSHSTQPQQNRCREHKAAKDVAVVLGVYLLCYLPAWIAILCRQVLPLNSVPVSVSFITNGWLLSKSAWNPVIYCIRKQEFRLALKMMLHSKRVRAGNDAQSNQAPNRLNRSSDQ